MKVKNLMMMAIAALTMVLGSCGQVENKGENASVSKNKYVNYLQKDLDDENVTQFIVDLGEASERFSNLAKSDAEKAKEHIHEVRDFLDDNSRAIHKLNKKNDKLDDIVEKFMKIDPESADAINARSK